MATPRETFLAASGAAGDTYARATADSAVAAQHAVDQAKIDALTAQNQDLQTQLDAATKPAASITTLHGSACAGWWSGKAGTAKETRQQGTARIVKAFPGIGVWRAWETIPSYLAKAQAIFLDCNAVGNVKGGVTALLAWNPGVHWISCWHEPENDAGVVIKDWQNAQMNAAAINRANGQGRVRYVSLLMGMTGIPSRNPPHSAEEWFNFDMGNVDCIGADLYQNASSDSDMDSAADVLMPWIGLARKLNKPLVIGEFGVRRVSPEWTPGVSDTARAQYSADAIAIMRREKFADGSPVVQANMIYESDSGNAGRLPWNFLPPPDQANSTTYSPKTVQAWAAAFGTQPQTAAVTDDVSELGADPPVSGES